VGKEYRGNIQTSFRLNSDPSTREGSLSDILADNKLNELNRNAPILATSSTQIVETSGWICLIVSKITIPAVTDPP